MNIKTKIVPYVVLTCVLNSTMLFSGNLRVLDETSNITFGSCENEDPCENNPVDCLGGCAFKTDILGNKVQLFDWSRTIFEEDSDKAKRATIQGMKSCLDDTKIEPILKDAVSKYPADGQELKLPCNIQGSTWNYIYPQFSIQN